MTAATDEQVRLAALARYDVVGTQAPAELGAICELAARLCGTPGAAVNLIDETSQHQVAAYGGDPGVCSREDSMCAVTLAIGADTAVPDTREDPRFAQNPWVTGRLGAIRFYAGSVLRSPGGQIIGTLCVFGDRPGTLPEEARRGLETLAKQVIDVLELRVQRRLLTQTLDELSRSHEQLASFAGQVSHDLKTPLTSCIGFLELLEDMPSVAANAEAREYTARCTASSRRMLTMIEELLAYAHVGGQLQPVDNDIDAVMGQVVEDLGDAATLAAISWSGGAVRADAAQLRVLLQNLAMPSPIGGRTVRRRWW